MKKRWMNNKIRFSTIFLPVLNVFQHFPTQCNREKKGIFYKIKRSPPWNWRRDNGVARRKKLCCPCASFRCASPWTFFDFCERNPQSRAVPPRHFCLDTLKNFFEPVHFVADPSNYAENRGYVPLIEILNEAENFSTLFFFFYYRYYYYYCIFWILILKFLIGLKFLRIR